MAVFVIRLVVSVAVGWVGVYGCRSGGGGDLAFSVFSVSGVSLVNGSSMVDKLCGLIWQLLPSLEVCRPEQKSIRSLKYLNTYCMDPSCCGMVVTCFPNVFILSMCMPLVVKSPVRMIVLLKVFSTESLVVGEVELSRPVRFGEGGWDGVEDGGVVGVGVVSAIAASSAGGGGKWDTGFGKGAGKVRCPYVVASTST